MPIPQENIVLDDVDLLVFFFSIRPYFAFKINQEMYVFTLFFSFFKSLSRDLSHDLRHDLSSGFEGLLSLVILKDGGLR